MNVYKIKVVGNLSAASAAIRTEFLQFVLTFVVVESEMDFDEDGGTISTYIVETMFQINLPASNATVVYLTILIDTNCTQILTNLLKPQLTQGDLVAIIATTVYGSELRNYEYGSVLSTTSILQIGIGTGTQSSSYPPFVGSLGAIFFGRDAVQGIRTLIGKSKQMSFTA